MRNVDVDFVSVQMQVGVRDGARLVCVLVGMRVRMPATVTVCVDVHSIGVVVVNGAIRVGSISVILVAPRISVIAMVVVEMIRIGHIQVVVVRWGYVLVVVIAMTYIPV